MEPMSPFESQRPAQRVDVLIVGAGQAGLALGYSMKQTPLRFLIADANARVGDSWRRRYDSLVLFTPRSYSALPGLRLAGDADGFPGKDEQADYLEAYARHFELPVRLGSQIERLERQAHGFRAVVLGGAVVEARAVVIASGAFQQPALPPMAGQMAGEVQQFTPREYRCPAQVPPGAVLVVGDGATGRQIARDLAASHHVTLAASGRAEPIAHRLLGKSVFWWMDRLGLLLAPADTALGSAIRRRDPIPGPELRLPGLRRAGVRIARRLVAVKGRRMEFADGQSLEVDAVIWATGYADDSAWVAIPEVKDSQGNFVQTAGRSPVPGLYFIGRSWQRTAGSARLYGVGADAAALARDIAVYLERMPATSWLPVVAGT
jgi:putative flavoprotein involved in K+ transport